MRNVKTIGLLFLTGMIVGSVWATDYRDFMDAQGRTIRARILRYDAKKKSVTVERDNRKVVTVPLSIFSEQDQSYVLQWDFNKVFLSESKFKIEAKRKRVKKIKGQSGNYDYEGEYLNEEKVENTAYEISLQNKSTSKLENLEVEYCIFYEQEKVSRGKQITEDGVRYGTLDIPSLLPKSKKELMTEAVSVYTNELNPDWIYSSGASNKQTGKVRGIWLRVNMKLKSGEKITRDYCLPDSLSNSKVWTTTTLAVGMNRSKRSKK